MDSEYRTELIVHATIAPILVRDTPALYAQRSRNRLAQRRLIQLVVPASPTAQPARCANITRRRIMTHEVVRDLILNCTSSILETRKNAS